MVDRLEGKLWVAVDAALDARRDPLGDERVLARLERLPAASAPRILSAVGRLAKRLDALDRLDGEPRGHLSPAAGRAGRRRALVRGAAAAAALALASVLAFRAGGAHPPRVERPPCPPTAAVRTGASASVVSLSITRERRVAGVGVRRAHLWRARGVERQDGTDRLSAVEPLSRSGELGGDVALLGPIRIHTTTRRTLR